MGNERNQPISAQLSLCTNKNKNSFVLILAVIDAKVCQKGFKAFCTNIFELFLIDIDMYFLNLLSVVHYVIYKYESLHTKHETQLL